MTDKTKLKHDVIRHPAVDNSLQHEALEQACKQLGMDSHITIIQSAKDCRTDADKKAYNIIGKPFVVKRSYLNCNSLDVTFFYNNEGEATYTYCGYGDPVGCIIKGEV